MTALIRRMLQLSPGVISFAFDPFCSLPCSLCHLLCTFYSRFAYFIISGFFVFLPSKFARHGAISGRNPDHAVFALTLIVRLLPLCLVAQLPGHGALVLSLCCVSIPVLYNLGLIYHTSQTLCSFQWLSYHSVGDRAPSACTSAANEHPSHSVANRVTEYKVST